MIIMSTVRKTKHVMRLFQITSIQGGGIVVGISTYALSLYKENQELLTFGGTKLLKQFVESHQHRP
jgi:hypothetical protein